MEIYLNPLPGKEAHIRLAPIQRRTDMFLDIYPPKNAKRSAVLVLLLPGGSSWQNSKIDIEEILKWRVLIIQRNSYNGIHSAQAAFPGGKREESDSSFADTAIREAEEETGIKREDFIPVSYLSQLYVPPSNFLIQPLLAIAKDTPQIVPDAREVSRYLEIPISVFKPGNEVYKSFSSPSGELLDAPGYEYDGLFIWGATAMILSELYQVVEEAVLSRLLSKTYISSSNPLK
ncbi:MAG: hypothetical protein BGO30_11475 [Bacteroidetes bacterium 41-46]|nr:MAG: hypothetical protein BGO30_11475 [Bacteroidetes bacterium 41-46]